ncbi:MAG: S41 family peptidase [Lachnospiraceae bacterium]|nr:S41 family peptidase [Lachnospiraceae bacterium]
MYVAPTADAAEAVNGTVKEYSVREKTLPMYLGAVDSKEDLSVYYINESGVPYIPVEFIPHILNKWLEVDQYEISAGENENIVTVLRKNTLFTAEFDFGEDTVTFIDYDAFMKPEGEPLVSLNVMSSEIGYLFKPIEELTNDRYGKEICFDLKPYEIDLVMHDGDHYVPLHTISDLMLSYYNTYSLYNGESVIITAGLDKELADIYYSCAPERTEEFALFDYHELCFALDHLYGLKEIHGIDSFDDYFYEIGMRKRLKSTDQSEADAAMYEFITCFLDDLHSSFNDLSCGTDPDVYFKKVENIVGPWKTKFDGWIEEFDAERSRFYPDGYLPYEEVGNTAFITFDNFSHISEDIDYLSEPSEEELNDTIRLMQYSYDRIMRKDSPVENVVMDLSVNTGGSIHAACYVLGMYLGRGSINIKNTMTGATTTSQYHIDANRDGNYDDKDTFANSGLNLYCMISPVSFSCGNLVPNEFKADPHITLIGKTSGGGSCSIMPMATAGGNIFTISGYRRMSTFKNGSFYDIDRGADPDIYIAKIADFYDREYIADLINGNE